MADTIDTVEKELDEKFKQYEDQINELKEKGATSEEVEALKELIDASGVKLEEYINGEKEKIVENYTTQFKNFLVENKSELENIKSQKSGTIEFVPKAVGDITRGSGTQGAGTVPNVLMNNFNHVRCFAPRFKYLPQSP